jgi:L-ascorbate metabolism protein UlaG (beta-lactamase superfamily)
VFFAGDTAYGPHFAQIRQAFGPLQASLLPIGSYLPRSMMSAQHLSPEEALKAAQELGADCFIPIHYATFPDGDDGYDQPLEDLQTALKAAPHQREQVRVLPMGQALNF